MASVADRCPSGLIDPGPFLFMISIRKVICNELDFDFPSEF